MTDNSELNDLGVFDAELLEQIRKFKGEHPEQFVSYWEMDENDIDEPSTEDLEKNIGLKFLKAAETGDKDLVEELFKTDNTVLNYHDSDGYTALHRASYNGHTDIIKFLLAVNADIESKTNDDWTPLHSACRWDQVESAKILLENGAIINALTKSGQTPLHIAANFSENDKVLRLLLSQKEIDVNIKNNLNETARQICVRSNPFEYVFDERVKLETC